MVANKYAFLQITRRRFLNEWEAFKKVISRRNIRRRITIPLTLSNLKLLRRITRTENILHRNFTRRQVAIQNRVASNIGISQSTFSVKVLNLFSRSRRKTNKRKSKHSAMLRNKETRHRMFIGLLNTAAEGLTKRSAVGFLLRSLIMFQTFISRHNSNFFSDKLVLTSVTPASSAPVLQTPKATSSSLYFDSLTVNAGNGGFLHCIQMDTSVNAANQVVSVGADIAFDADPKFFACLVRFESSSVPTTLPTAYDVYPLDGRHDGGYYTVKDCVTIDVLPRTPGNNVYVGFMVWSNFTATKCRGLVSLNQVIK